MGLDQYKLSPWLDKLPFQWESMKKHGKVKQLKKDHYLFHHGEDFERMYIVESGRIRLYLITMDGREKTVSIIGENGLLGEQFLPDSQSHITSAIAVSDSTLIEIDKRLFKQLALENKDLTKQWLEMLSMKLELLTQSMLHLSFDSSLSRVVHAFIQLAKSYGIKEADGSIRISITFTHQELGDLIGATRVTVSNSIKRLYEIQLIYKEERFYYIPDIGRLNEFLSNNSKD